MCNFIYLFLFIDLKVIVCIGGWYFNGSLLRFMLGFVFLIIWFIIILYVCLL